jgi:hypothetical protein
VIQYRRRLRTNRSLIFVGAIAAAASNGGEIFAEVAVKFGLAMFIMNLAVKALSSYYFARCVYCVCQSHRGLVTNESEPPPSLVRLHKELVAEQLGE